MTIITETHLKTHYNNCNNKNNCRNSYKHTHYNNGDNDNNYRNALKPHILITKLTIMSETHLKHRL